MIFSDDLGEMRLNTFVVVGLCLNTALLRLAKMIQKTTLYIIYI
jgi:hypothetical protein